MTVETVSLNRSHGGMQAAERQRGLYKTVRPCFKPELFPASVEGSLEEQT